ncbi:FAD-binding protein [Brevifollis gellanilyticus]|uniref:2-hydroxy-acid oxidase n=1 Tax=Brevifollis gellanilyticus TaxID=748831 RepID=A0A512M593_9BACT|nr:FAD-binding protein [Brevifollis gellanilyticus]GEP41899.1 2-hydroxy-acid oxidase [Brevifollis gellanilyticus]
MITPSSLTELRDAVLSAPRVIAVGAVTKPRLSAVEAVKISTRCLSGITEYEPGEFTFTALAGTPVKEIIAALAEKGQYLPFDPMLVEAGSTIGGVVASGLSGPGRFRYGGVRDFILGVRFVDGMGRLLRLGGKVVKNAAGFDVPKFLVGSLGRFGVIGEVTFKVFPKPETEITLELPFELKRLTGLASSRFEAAALDVLPGGEKMLVKLAGPGKALEVLAQEIGGNLVDNSIWSQIRETPWSFKTDITSDQVHEHKASHISCGGNVALSHDRPARGLTLRGEAPLWIGDRPRFAIESAVKQALDPQHRFPTLDD